MPDQPSIHRFEMERRDAAGNQVERVGREFLEPAGAEHRHDRPVQQGHERHVPERGDDDDNAMVTAGPPQEHQQEREHQVVLHDDDQEVKLVIPGGYLLGEFHQRRRRTRVVRSGQQVQEVDDAPAQVRDSDREEPPPVEAAQAAHAEVHVGVRQHPGRDEEESLTGKVGQQHHGVGAHAGRRRDEVGKHVRADHAGLLHRPHGVDLVEPLACHQDPRIRSRKSAASRGGWRAP
jgi:hypothetical protein